MQRTRTTAAFTLVEMLTVIVIMAILIAIAIPAVTSLTKSTGLQSATRQLSSTLSLVRQDAITQRSVSFVLFRRAATNFTVVITRTLTNCPPDDLWRETVVTNWADALALSSQNTYAAGRAGKPWQFITRFEDLPVGIVIDYDRSGLTTGFVDEYKGKSPLYEEYGDVGLCTNVLKKTAVTNYYTRVSGPIILFKPTGAAEDDGFIRLAEGYVDVVSKTNVITGTNWVSIAFDKLVGRVRVERP